MKEELQCINNLNDFKLYEEAYNEFLNSDEFEEEVYNKDPTPKDKMDFNEILQLLDQYTDHYNEDWNGDYLNTYAIIETENFRFELGSSQYRKDNSLCDRQLDEFFTIIDLRIEKENENT